MSQALMTNFYVPLGVLTASLALATAWAFRDRLGSWFRITPRVLGIGVAAGLLQALLTHVGYGMLAPVFPALRAEVVGLYQLMATGLGPMRALPIILLAVAVEEVIWRGVLVEPNDARGGALLRATASTLLYTAAQTGTGSWALALTAFVCGWAWWAIRHFTRSLTPAIVMHVLWSLIVLVFVPLEPLP